MEELCSDGIHKGMMFRVIATVFALLIINRMVPKGNILFLILPLTLFALDLADGMYNYKYKDLLYDGMPFGCNKVPEYVLYDKWIDYGSYLFMILLFTLDAPLVPFLMIRLVGLLLFTITQRRKVLILGFDFVKELLLYMYFFGKDYRYLPIAIGIKVLFEVQYHYR